MTKIDWIRGDSLGLDIPAHSDALRSGGEAFLTRAFRAACSISQDNSITRISRCEEISGGSTGRKLLLSVEYAKPGAELHTDLFVKFSRDFDDSIRDRTKTQMELEVLFALLSRDPEFPIAVPICYFADYHHESGTGILITQCVPYGKHGVEPHYDKCLDYKMPDQLQHYQAIIRALARLAGTHKAGRLANNVEKYFPFNPNKLAVSVREPYTPQQISARVADYCEFSRDFPQLLPEKIRSEKFLTRLRDEAPRFQALEVVGKKILQSEPDMIALCHWNAHVDNAWFWRDENNQIDCGLIDWGNVSQMNVAMAIWGCLSAAELEIWNEHLDDLLHLFISEFTACGGPPLDIRTLKLHLNIYVAMMGLAWMLDTPKLTFSKIANLSEADNRFNPLIENNERARSQLLIMTAFLNLWQNQDMNQVIGFMEAFA